MSKYQDSIHIRYAYVQTDSGTKCLDDYYKERFDTLQEACDKADKYDLLVELLKSYDIQNFAELRLTLESCTHRLVSTHQVSNIINAKLDSEDLYAIVRSLAWLDSSNPNMPSFEYLNGLIEYSKKEYLEGIKNETKILQKE